MIDHYDWAGGREAMWRFGPAQGPAVVAALPLFEEGNRTRRLVVELLHALAARGIGGMLPDMPGTGESLIDTAAVTLAGWRAAYSAAAGTHDGPTWSIAIRGGWLVDGAAEVAGHWRLSPVDGATLVRELRRGIVMAAALEGRKVRSAPLERGGDPLSIGGNSVKADLLLDLTGITPVPGRTVRLAGESGPADRHLSGTGPWRRADSASDPALVQALATDIADWIAVCAS